MSEIRQSDTRVFLRNRAALYLIVVACVVIEFALQAADLHLLGTPAWRGLVYQNGAFWAGLLHNWRPNYGAQPWTMFLTHSLLHGGLGHLAGNMLTLLVIGRRLLERVGQNAFLLIYVLSAIGGGIGFGLLATSPRPMVGASGALFGIAGALIQQDRAERRRFGLPTAPVWWTVAGLALLNLALWLALEGLLAWETHLGGFVAGWLAAALLGRFRRRDRR